MPQKSGPNPEKSSRRGASSAPEPLIIGEERVKFGQDDPSAPPLEVIGFAQTENPAKLTQRQRIQALEAETAMLRAEISALQRHPPDRVVSFQEPLETERRLSAVETLIPTVRRLGAERNEFLADAADRLTRLERKVDDLDASSVTNFNARSNQRTRRYAVVAHDQAIEYVDKCFDRLIERTTSREEADELFERLQAVEQYIRADDALNHSFAYSNTENEREERRAWRTFRAAALDKIGRITRNYVRRD